MPTGKQAAFLNAQSAAKLEGFQDAAGPAPVPPPSTVAFGGDPATTFSAIVAPFPISCTATLRHPLIDSLHALSDDASGSGSDDEARGSDDEDFTHRDKAYGHGDQERGGREGAGPGGGDNVTDTAGGTSVGAYASGGGSRMDTGGAQAGASLEGSGDADMTGHDSDYGDGDDSDLGSGSDLDEEFEILVEEVNSSQEAWPFGKGGSGGAKGDGDGK